MLPEIKGEKYMTVLPEDPMILFSFINTKLRDNYVSDEDAHAMVQVGLSTGCVLWLFHAVGHSCITIMPYLSHNS